jgi:hypothetical protein
MAPVVSPMALTLKRGATLGRMPGSTTVRAEAAAARPPHAPWKGQGARWCDAGPLSTLAAHFRSVVVLAPPHQADVSLSPDLHARRRFAAALLRLCIQFHATCLSTCHVACRRWHGDSAMYHVQCTQLYNTLLATDVLYATEVPQIRKSVKKPEFICANCFVLGSMGSHSTPSKSTSLGGAAQKCACTLAALRRG